MNEGNLVLDHESSLAKARRHRVRVPKPCVYQVEFVDG